MKPGPSFGLGSAFILPNSALYFRGSTSSPHHDGVKPSTISTPTLHPLPGLHAVAYQAGGLPAVLLPYGMGDLILGRVSHLDAFSGYLNRT